jgi:hypothetical protein
LAGWTILGGGQTGRLGTEGGGEWEGVARWWRGDGGRDLLFPGKSQRPTETSSSATLEEEVKSVNQEVRGGQPLCHWGPIHGVLKEDCPRGLSPFLSKPV